mmetsp:Transcript_131351/g.238907  ORF Transcript_131351/g.238907 Transcript_131351/m.238907 type:complete len:147 (+) Transcript_131351:932-1372(+)
MIVLMIWMRRLLRIGGTVPAEESDAMSEHVKVYEAAASTYCKDWITQAVSRNFVDAILLMPAVVLFIACLLMNRGVISVLMIYALYRRSSWKVFCGILCVQGCLAEIKCRFIYSQQPMLGSATQARSSNHMNHLLHHMISHVNDGV